MNTLCYVLCLTFLVVTVHSGGNTEYYGYLGEFVWPNEHFTVATTEGQISIIRATYGSPVCGEKDVTEKLRNYMKNIYIKSVIRFINFDQLNSIFGDNCVGHHKALKFYYKKRMDGDAVALFTVKTEEDMKNMAASLSFEGGEEVEEEEEGELY
jgi:hypothetical protein